MNEWSQCDCVCHPYVDLNIISRIGCLLPHLSMAQFDWLKFQKRKVIFFFLSLSYRIFCFIFATGFSSDLFYTYNTLHLYACHTKLFQFLSNWLTSMLTKMTHGFFVHLIILLCAHSILISPVLFHCYCSLQAILVRLLRSICSVFFQRNLNCGVFFSLCVVWYFNAVNSHISYSIYTLFAYTIVIIFRSTEAISTPKIYIDSDDVWKWNRIQNKNVRRK